MDSAITAEVTGCGDIEDIYSRLFSHHGSQHWWPADSAFEVMVGAVLTQNTAWKNVEKAIQALHIADVMLPARILDLTDEQLGELLRPSGYFNVKARRLKSLCTWLSEVGGIDALSGWGTSELREGLLDIHGVGPETADDILLYALDRPVFVIDAYTRRIFCRLGLIQGEEPYEELREMFETALDGDTGQFNEYHALIVRHAARVCRVRPACGDCCLADVCEMNGVAE